MPAGDLLPSSYRQLSAVTQALRRWVLQRTDRVRLIFCDGFMGELCEHAKESYPYDADDADMQHTAAQRMSVAGDV